MRHTFTVSESEGAPSHDVAITIPSFAEATAQQRETAWAEAQRSITIKVQGQLRRALAKGVRGAALNAEAQRRYLAILNERPAQSAAVTVDARLLNLTHDQCIALEAQGAIVLNKPEPPTAADETE